MVISSVLSPLKGTLKETPKGSPPPLLSVFLLQRALTLNSIFHLEALSVDDGRTGLIVPGGWGRDGFNGIVVDGNERME